MLCIPEPQLICMVKATICFAQTQPQGGDAGRVHFVRDDVDAAQDDQIERRAVKRLPRQQGPPALHRQIDGRERPRRLRAFRNGVRAPSTR